MRDLVVSGLFLSALVFIRPISYYLPVWMTVILLLWTCAQRVDRVKRIAYAAIFLIVSSAPLLAWQARNYVETGYSGFSTAQDFNLHWYVTASIVADRTKKTVMQQQWEMKDIKLSEQRTKAVNTVLEHPYTFLKIYVKGQLKFWLHPGSLHAMRLLKGYRYDWIPSFAVNMDSLIGGKSILGRQMVYLHHSPFFFWTGVILELVMIVYLSLAAGFFLFGRFMSKSVLVVVGVAIYFSITYFDIGDAARFRLPIMPLICLFSGYAAWLLLTKHPRAAT